jgi:type VI secretion system protein ImpG
VTCSYTTAHEVNLLPLKIDKVELGGVPADLPLAQLGLSQRGIGSALRIRIACDGPQNLGHLDFDRLEFFLGGPDIEALKLLELVMEHHAGIVCQTVSPQPQRQLLASDALRQEGFEPDQALLPDDLRNFDGYRLLQEYFVSGPLPLHQPERSGHAYRAL